MLHVDIPTLAEFKALAQVKGETCISLYLPTSPLGDSARVNRTAFKDLAKDEFLLAATAQNLGKCVKLATTERGN